MGVWGVGCGVWGVGRREKQSMTWELIVLLKTDLVLFVGVLLGKVLKTIFLENYPYSSPFHTKTRRASNPITDH